MTRQKWFRCVLCRKRMVEGETWEVTPPEIGPDGNLAPFVACSVDCLSEIVKGVRS